MFAASDYPQRIVISNKTKQNAQVPLIPFCLHRSPAVIIRAALATIDKLPIPWLFFFFPLTTCPPTHIPVFANSVAQSQGFRPSTLFQTRDRTLWSFPRIWILAPEFRSSMTLATSRLELLQWTRAANSSNGFQEPGHLSSDLSTDARRLVLPVSSAQKMITWSPHSTADNEVCISLTFSTAYGVSN